MSKFIYTGSKTKEISFPLGGIGTGCIGLSGNGRLIDWEIFNKPNKGGVNNFSHFAIKAETEDEVVDARVLQGDLQSPYIGEYNKPHFTGFGFGPHRSTLAGIPHFEDLEFIGEFPLAKIKFKDEKFPGRVEMEAFNPFIPLNDKDSSIPAAFFDFEVENTTEKILTYTLALSLNNPLPVGSAINSYGEQDGMKYVLLNSDKYQEDHSNYGNLCASTDSEDISYQEYWFRGRWFDNIAVFWRDFSKFGKLKNRKYETKQVKGVTQAYGLEEVCTIASHVKLAPGEKKSIRYIISWSFPVMYKNWTGVDGKRLSLEETKTWKNYYATIFRDSVESASYSLKNWKRLYNETLLFKNTLFSSTLPQDALEAVSANLSILKSPTCLRLEDGSFYGFEGVHNDEGCCEGSCTHVWNYAYALPYLFPKLERSMRDLDFNYNQREDGAMSFRLMLPLGSERWNFRPCADGQFGGVVKAYRDWKISGDTKWLKKNWTAIKKSIEFAWAETNEDKWDIDKSGVLYGRQHHTLDMELFSPNSWLTGFYLAALKAGAEIAEHFGESEKTMEYQKLFEKGKSWVDKNLFNGEYYHQKVELRDRSILERFNANTSFYGDTVLDAYWNEEAHEIMYQIAEGCEIDQVIAQWHANLCGLGDIFDREQVKKGLASIYKYNFKKSMREHYNPCRLYCLNDEAGLVICEWPEGKYKPAVPLPYSEETQNGYEYQAAIHMIQEGLVKEGLECISAIRDRYDGEKRNPWNEFECGSNYARSMASYALILTFSGFEYDMVNGIIGFNPIRNEKEEFECFWSLDSGWGSFESNEYKLLLSVKYGHLKLNRFVSDILKNKVIKTLTINGCDFEDFSHQNESIYFNSSIIINTGELIEVTFK